MSASSIFKQMVEERPLISVMAAHNPLTARLVEEAGFDAIWASGFELSASLGIPDASIFTMTEQVENVRNMSGAIDIPIVADIDTGYGNAINVIHAIEAIEGAGKDLQISSQRKYTSAYFILSFAKHRLMIAFPCLSSSKSFNYGLPHFHITKEVFSATFLFMYVQKVTFILYMPYF